MFVRVTIIQQVLVQNASLHTSESVQNSLSLAYLCSIWRSISVGDEGAGLLETKSSALWILMRLMSQLD